MKADYRSSMPTLRNLWEGAVAALALTSPLCRAQPLDRDLFDGSGHNDAMRMAVNRYMGPRDVCLVDFHMPNDDVMAEFSTKNHARYAQAHGYSYYGFEGRVSGERFVNPARGTLDGRFGGGLTWQKLSALAAVAVQIRVDHLPRCAWLMWLDTDAVFTNLNKPVGPIIEQYASDDQHVLLARDSTGYDDSFVNSGVFFVRNSWQGRAFLQDVESLYEKYKEGPLTDQYAIQEVAFGRDPRGLLMTERALMESGLRPHIALAPQRAFNSFVRDELDPESLVLDESNWQPCDLIVHMAGKPKEFKAQGMRDAVERGKSCDVPALAVALRGEFWESPSLKPGSNKAPKHFRPTMRSLAP